MKQFTVCLLLGALLGVIPPSVPAQQSRSSQHTTQEIEALKNRVSELEKQLQIVENVEKLELKAKLAEANAKLVKSEFGKFERGLKDSNDEWLRGWSSWFLGVIGVFVAILIGVGAVFWFWLRLRADGLITDRVERSIAGFKDSIEELGIQRKQLRLLEKEHTFSILEFWGGFSPEHESDHPEPIKALREEVLLEVLIDERYQNESQGVEVKSKAMRILAARKSLESVTPALQFLNKIIDSELDVDFETGQHLVDITSLLSYINTQEAYQGLITFLHRLLTENLKHKDALLRIFVTPAVYSIALTGFRLNLGDSVSTLRLAIPHLEIVQAESTAVKNLARYFDIFNEPTGIKEILSNHGPNLPSDVEDKCLELLDKHDSTFVEEWRARKAAAGNES